MIKILGLKGVKNMSKTVVRKNESLDDALRRFKRAVTKGWYSSRKHANVNSMKNLL